MNPFGPQYPTVAADGANGFVAWTNPNNAKVEDGVSATDSVIGPGGGGGFPNQLKLSAFAFNLPATAVIDGIKLEAKVLSGATAVSDFDIHLETTGPVVTSTASALGYGVNSWPTGALTWISWGGSTKTWGRTWTPAEINSASFLASISGMPGTGTGSVSVDSVRVTVWWHTAPATVPKRYLYKVFTSAGQYLGNLPNVISEFTYVQDINTAGTNINIECGVSADTSILATQHLLTEAGDFLTDEAGNRLVTESQTPVVSIGASTDQTLIKNGNKLVVYEYSTYYPNGLAKFSGRIEHWEAGFGGEGGFETIKLLAYSDGSDLDNYIARGSPYAYTIDQSLTSANSSVVDSTDAFAGWNRYGQTFIVGPGVTNLGALSVMLLGTANVTVSLYTSPTSTTPLASATQAISTVTNTEIQFGFTAPVTVTPGAQYFLTVTVAAGQSIQVWIQNTGDLYAGGQAYNSNYGGGSGGGTWTPMTNQDLYFRTWSSLGSTTGTYTSQDPTNGMLIPIVQDYQLRGGVVIYDSTTIDATGLSLTYTFNTNTIYEAIKAVLTMCPNGFYYYVDLGTNTLYVKQTSTSADFTFTKGKHINELTIIASIENIKNQVYFSGGAVASVNVYVQKQSNTSVALYGVRLDRQSDNRVTDVGTAGTIASGGVSKQKDEQYQTTVTILGSSMDTNLLKPGKVIGFNGFGTFADRLTSQIVRLEYHPDYVVLGLGILPKRMTPEFEKITRGLVAQQTVANPTAPS